MCSLSLTPPSTSPSSSSLEPLPPLHCLFLSFHQPVIPTRPWFCLILSTFHLRLVFPLRSMVGNMVFTFSFTRGSSGNMDGYRGHWWWWIISLKPFLFLIWGSCGGPPTARLGSGGSASLTCWDQSPHRHSSFVRSYFSLFIRGHLFVFLWFLFCFALWWLLINIH